ncbi:hypothetical protein [Micromonospora sp. 4G55]|uniref:hypothetical protein n=1 Tax=Micromonospora sp. 4G55 TaxID=2806102 RepID=UPI001A41EC95|nr:hypothetical protein [Micromonospora sp. 4G55]MBM0255725.1 hypothetical protein [Micromonospora sp. 4G55]
MRKIRALLGVTIAGACALAGLPGVALAAPAAPYTVLVIDLNDHQRLSTDLFTGAWDGDNSSAMEAQLGDGDALTLGAHWRDETDHVWNAVSTAPPAGETWQAGRTYAATSAGGAGATLSLDGSGQTCAGSGEVTVKRVERDAATERMTAFAAAYTFHCDGDPGVIDGEIRWNSDLGYSALDHTSRLDFSEVVLGSTARTSASFAPQGTVPVTFGAASLSGTGAAAFEIVENTCSGRTLVVGDICDVRIRAVPTRAGTHEAVLLLADGSSYGQRRVPVTAQAEHSAVGTYYPVSPGRIMDTRYGVPNLPQAPIGPGGEVDLQVAGRADLPAEGVSAVVLNVTVTGPTADGFVTVYPSGEARPTASSVNFAKGWLGSNNVTVKLGANGKVKVYNRAGSTHVVVDVVGFYAGSNSVRQTKGLGGQFHPVKPTRLVDTRTTGTAIPAGAVRRFFVDFGPELSGRAGALVLNITAVAPEKSGFLTAWSGSGDVPSASTVNYGAGRVVPNLAVVQSNFHCDCGTTYGVNTFSLYSSQKAHVVVDLVGVMDQALTPNGLRFTPTSPTRIVDSRSGLGTAGALGPNVTRTVTAPPALVTDATQALAMNVTAVAPTNATVLTVWPAGAGLSKPTASNLNPAAGQTVSNAAISGIGPADAFHAHNLAGTTHLVADVVGRFDLYPYTVGTGGTFTVVRSGPAV